jgi:hypothetical protein
VRRDPAALLRIALPAALLFGPVAGVATARGADAPLLPVTETAASQALLLAGSDPAWAHSPETRIDINRTPALYEGDPMDDGERPEVRVSVVRGGGGMAFRLRWTDPTESRPQGLERVPDAGDPSIYKAHSQDLERFADAACVMVPREPGPRAAFPALMMGEKGAPVELYYWHLVRGFERLEAAGRGTTTRTGESFPGAFRRSAAGWEAVFILPDLPAGTPVSFAVWDGDRDQRDGLKFFSVWYELAP